MKLDISQLHRVKLTWGDEIPNELKEIWASNFKTLDELRKIKFRRTIVPSNAKNLDIITLDTADASSKLICVAIYARFELKDNSFSCQLIFARSKVLPEDTSTPRAELMAATMNAATGHTVKKALGNFHKRSIKFSDSLVALHWISNERTSLKTWVRNRVIEINRLCNIDDWKHVKSGDMIADLGTRQTAKLSDIMEDGLWTNGYPWMSQPECNFPAKSIQDIKLTIQDSNAMCYVTLFPA